jgi:hypothetical protein
MVSLELRGMKNLVLLSVLAETSKDRSPGLLRIVVTPVA